MKVNMDVVSLKNLDLSEIRFEEVRKKRVGNFKHKQIKIRRGREMDNGEEILSDLLVRTNEVFSFGISEYEGGKYMSYSLPLCLYERDKPTKEERDWVENFEKIIKKCNEEIDKHKSLRGMEKVSPLYQKRGYLDARPILYAKMPHRKENFSCKFYRYGEEIEPKSMIFRLANVKAAVKIDSIMITDKIKIKVDLVCAKVTNLVRIEEREEALSELFGYD